MIYYIALLAFILILRIFTKCLFNEKRGDIIFISLSCIAVILFQGFRAFTVGTDLGAYIPAYSEIGKELTGTLKYQNFEPGFVLLNKILYKLGLSPRAFLICVAAIIQIPIFYTIYKNSEDKLMSLLWYFSFGKFFFTFSGLRQSISMAICFAAYPFVKNKKPLYFCAFCLFAALFHSSALLALVIYPLYHFKIPKSWYAVGFCVIALLFIFRNNLLQIAAPYMGSYGSPKYFHATGAYTLFLMYCFLMAVSLYKNNPDVKFTGLRGLLLLVCFIYSFAPSHELITRYAYVFELYISLFIPELVDSFNFKPDILCKIGCYSILTLCMFYIAGELNTLPFSFSF